MVFEKELRCNPKSIICMNHFKKLMNLLQLEFTIPKIEGYI
jgi:hypothetical protein